MAETATTFASATAVTACGDGRYDIDISADWRAGRGPHGGYLAATILRALMATVDEPARAPRSLTIHYLRAPRPGPAAIRTTVERVGRSLTSLSARLEQDGELQALALAAFSLSRTAPELDDRPLPAVAPADPRPDSPIGDFDGRPRFVAHLVMQPRFGPMPFTGRDDEPMCSGGWLGLFEAQPLDHPALALFADAWWSPPFGRLREPATSPTVDLTIHFRDLPEHPDPQALYLARFQTGLVHDGFFENDADIWSPDGQLLAQARQLALLLPLPGR